eukprot:gnl/TRDRNA2_/TRDRNA2_44363_c0_seq1.p1 gnl/TRDRNA2_/TRDRNA2_44363_c0~~gnl/TRDRNA2_/TRDRNA2_44363_c0_seq1.p1  ORF type:complete len:168 (-),score=52.35 gnl/TRDRNA2_/TRDRNA2_44363_c0_seq1:404-907(-)
MEDYQGNKREILIADVDCTAQGGQELCHQFGVRGYPNIKYGDPDNLQDYPGERSYGALKAFAASLPSPCTPNTLKVCDATMRSTFQDLMALNPAEVDRQVNEKEEQMQDVRKEFEAVSERLNQEFQEASQKREDAIKAIKTSHYNSLKKVQKYNLAKKKKSSKKKEL